MVAVLAGVIGVVVGGVVAWALAQRRAGDHREALATLRADLAVRESELTAARSDVVRAREEHAAALGNMEVVFENLSNRVLQQTVVQFNQSQDVAMKERETTLDRTLKPLADLLDEYKRNLAEFDKQHVGALGEVKSRAEELDVYKRQREEFEFDREILNDGLHHEVALTKVLELGRDTDASPDRGGHFDVEFALFDLARERSVDRDEHGVSPFGGA